MERRRASDERVKPIKVDENNKQSDFFGVVVGETNGSDLFVQCVVELEGRTGSQTKQFRSAPSTFVRQPTAEGA